MSDIRERAISYARGQQLSADMLDALCKMMRIDVRSDDDRWVTYRIGLDNMIAAGFEMGYAAAIDDRTPVKPLGGVNERRSIRVRAYVSSAQAARAAAKRKR